MNCSTLPTFIIIGAPKCGTTRMYQLLNTHPQVCMSKKKEPGFFALQSRWARGWDWYDGLFAPTDRTRAVGEASVDYSLVNKYPHVVDRINAHLPDVRLIFMVRHPVRRIESDWLMESARGRFSGQSLAQAMSHSHLLDASLYWNTISAYRRVFDDSRICVVFLEDMKADEEGELIRCFEHIGVSSDCQRTSSPLPAMVARDERREDRFLVRALRSWGVVKSMRQAMPRGLRSLAKGMLTKRRRIKAIWNQSLYDEVVAQVRPDAEQFLQWCGKPHTFWSWPDVHAVNARSGLPDQKLNAE